MRFKLKLTLFFSELVELLRHSALLKEGLHLVLVLLPHVLCVGRIRLLKEDSEEL